MSERSGGHVDVLILGAGLSGIGAAYHVQTMLPGKTFALLEAREAIGGTWDLFRYPGIRSDSDMFTLGYRFRPWRDQKAIADGPSIKKYIEDTAREFGLERHIRFRHRVVRAEWSSDAARWTVTAEVGPSKEEVRFTCGFLYTCTGYYDYARGYTPDFPGQARFGGAFVHPQHWPADLDYAGKRVVVIGSGATAVTLVPAMAEKAAHVTMLQRSPTYIASLPSVDTVAELLKRILPESTSYAATRWKNVLRAMLNYELSRKQPGLMKALLKLGVRQALGREHDVDRHFTPRYDPWDERMCLVPDGDLFKAMREGRASIVTDTIDTFTENGIRLTSGEHLDADVVVSATGLRLTLIGGIPLVVDGAPVDLSRSVTYKGMMYSGVPNLASAFGYTNASWTLKCDLTAEHVCRLLQFMDARGFTHVTPRARPEDGTLPVMDLKSGYVKRALDALPRQGDRTPWRLHQNYIRDLRMLRYGRVDDPALEFARA